MARARRGGQAKAPRGVAGRAHPCSRVLPCSAAMTLARPDAWRVAGGRGSASSGGAPPTGRGAEWMPRCKGRPDHPATAAAAPGMTPSQVAALLLSAPAAPQRGAGIHQQGSAHAARTARSAIARSAQATTGSRTGGVQAGGTGAMRTATCGATPKRASAGVELGSGLVTPGQRPGRASATRPSPLDHSLAHLTRSYSLPHAAMAPHQGTGCPFQATPALARCPFLAAVAAAEGATYAAAVAAHPTEPAAGRAGPLLPEPDALAASFALFHGPEGVVPLTGFAGKAARLAGGPSAGHQPPPLPAAGPRGLPLASLSIGSGPGVRCGWPQGGAEPRTAAGATNARDAARRQRQRVSRGNCGCVTS